MRLINGLSAIRTSLGQHVHSLPPSHRSPYLEGHMLAKQKERLEKELAQLEHRCQQGRLRLTDIAAKLEALSEQQHPNAPVPVASRHREETARVTSMTIKY